MREAFRHREQRCEWITKSKHEVKWTKTKHFVLMQLAHAPHRCSLNPAPVAQCLIRIKASSLQFGSTGGETRPRRRPPIYARQADSCASYGRSVHGRSPKPVNQPYDYTHTDTLYHLGTLYFCLHIGPQLQLLPLRPDARRAKSRSVWLLSKNERGG
jgi:hypothetical protein